VGSPEGGSLLVAEQPDPDGICPVAAELIAQQPLSNKRATFGRASVLIVNVWLQPSAMVHHLSARFTTQR
jgi:hypothetical protein